MSIPKIESSESLTLFLDGRTYTVRKNEAKYNAVAKAVEAEDIAAIHIALGTGAALKAYSGGKITIVDGEVTYKGKRIHNVITEKIIALFKAGKKYEYMLNFLERIQANPSLKAVEELYLFLEKAHIPITPNGHFLAYRKVDNSYLSYHANPDGTKNTNKVGETISMERTKVDGNRDSTCSTGLHFCSFSYLKSYNGGNGRVMIVDIDPADVVSIPSDYSNSKGRCCKYVVVAEHQNKETAEAFKDVVLANPDGTTHEGRDIDSKQIKFAKNKRRVNGLDKRIATYILGKLDMNKKVTIRQVQSSLAPRIPTIASLEKTIIKIGCKISYPKKGGKGAAVISE